MIFDKMLKNHENFHSQFLNDKIVTNLIYFFPIAFLFCTGAIFAQNTEDVSVLKKEAELLRKEIQILRKEKGKETLRAIAQEGEKTPKENVEDKIEEEGHMQSGHPYVNEESASTFKTKQTKNKQEETDHEKGGFYIGPVFAINLKSELEIYDTKFSDNSHETSKGLKVEGYTFFDKNPIFLSIGTEIYKKEKNDTAESMPLLSFLNIGIKRRTEHKTLLKFFGGVGTGSFLYESYTIPSVSDGFGFLYQFGLGLHLNKWSIDISYRKFSEGITFYTANMLQTELSITSLLLSISYDIWPRT